jgi:hypothetical protein
MLLLCKSFREGVAVGLAICGCIKRLFEDSSSGVAVEDMGQIQVYTIINFHFREQLASRPFKYQDGSADCYLAALCVYIQVRHL